MSSLMNASRALSRALNGGKSSMTNATISTSSSSSSSTGSSYLSLFSSTTSSSSGNRISSKALSVGAVLSGMGGVSGVSSVMGSGRSGMNYVSFSSSASADSDDGTVAIPAPVDGNGKPLVMSPKISALVDEIASLTLLESASLAEGLREKLGLPDMSNMAMPMMAAPGGASAVGSGSDSGEEAAAPAEEKSVFELKLMSFDAANKIKIIKAIRAIDSSLGIVDAKKKVEAAPVSIRGDLGKEKAEAAKKELEALGAVVNIL